MEIVLFRQQLDFPEQSGTTSIAGDETEVSQTIPGNNMDKFVFRHRLRHRMSLM